MHQKPKSTTEQLDRMAALFKNLDEREAELLLANSGGFVSCLKLRQQSTNPAPTKGETQ